MRVVTFLTALAVAQAAAAQTPTDTLVAEVRTLSAAADNDARFEALTALLRAHNLSFTVETFSLDKPPAAGPNAAPDPRTRGRNVVVTLGNGPDVVVAGAHYDAKWMTDKAMSQGAVDNAASSVMLVHAAEALKGERLGSRVTFVWFDMEESGLIGSAKYVDAHAGDRIKAMLNYDINGYGDTVIFGPPPGPIDPQLRRTMLETCAGERVDCLHFGGMPPGDDRSFGTRKIPALSIAILPAIEAHQLWLMLHAKSAGLSQGFAPPIFGTIHTPGDVPDKLEGMAIATAGRLAQALIRRVSELK
jgi:acetylornithine deacetylase/succinyl-diaminopimelate desuccinylase-like protein